jgi:hypothetical protein
MRTWKTLLAGRPRRNKKSSAKLGGRTLRMEGLEERRLMAADISLDPVTGILKIEVDDGRAVEVRQNINKPQDSSGFAPISSISAALARILSGVEVVVGGKLQQTVPSYLVKEVQFIGSNRNDRFTNNTDIDSTAQGYGGNDVLIGGSGSDSFYGGDGTDTLYGGTGNDILFGGAQDDMLDGGSGNDVLSGDAGQDKLYGRSGYDNLFGGDQKDWLYGGSGSDTLIGGRGNDILKGSSGKDAFLGTEAAETASWDRALGEWTSPFVYDEEWIDSVVDRIPLDVHLFETIEDLNAETVGGVRVTTDVELNDSGPTSNGFIVFDYQDELNYKLAGIDAALDQQQLVFAEVTNGRYREIASGPQDTSISSSGTYRLELELTTDEVTVKVSGRTLTLNRTVFADKSNLLDGKLGLGTSRAMATFRHSTVAVLK